MHKEFPSIYRLPVHVPDAQQVYYSDDAVLGESLDAASRTKLTEWFKYNREHTDALDTLYSDFPSKHVWHGSPRTSAHWALR